ncbi:hypothetical protein SDC9_73277 [bioreactor metagenome]|uniref:Uncharacterized protein n=1 Tax=bioreactor metagenome TaxID=1076179 RepID=A0A644YDQ6_9ZZZZ
MSSKINRIHNLRATLLRRMLIILSLPVVISGCRTSVKKPAETVVPQQDSTVVTPVDTAKPIYYNPEIQTDYGVIQITPRYDTARPVPLYGVKVPVTPK